MRDAKEKEKENENEKGKGKKNERKENDLVFYQSLDTQLDI